MKGIYLAAFRAKHENYNLDYNDIKKTSDHINIIDDMMKVDISKYDYIIATPPYNYWSIANYRRNESEYSLNTKHLLIEIIKKLDNQEKPFIIENVRNRNLFRSYDLYNTNCMIYEIGRHTYWTNIPINMSNINQTPDHISHKSKSKRQGGENVHNVIEYWLKVIHSK